MKLTYTEIKDDAGVILCIMRSDGWSIPCDPANSDYQAYLDRDKPKAALSTPIATNEVSSI